MIRNTKAQGISMNVVILAAIAVMVLLLVGTFMSGGFKALTGKITSFTSGSTASNATEAGRQTGCNTQCTAWANEGCKKYTASWANVKQYCNSTAANDDDKYASLKTICDCTSWTG